MTYGKIGRPRTVRVRPGRRRGRQDRHGPPSRRPATSLRVRPPVPRRRSIPPFAAACAALCSTAAAVAQPPAADLRALPVPEPIAVPAPLALPTSAVPGAAFPADPRGTGSRVGSLMPSAGGPLPGGVAGVSRRAGGFEVGVDRTRILTLEKDLPESAYEILSPEPQAAVAAGDESVLAVEVIDARRVRLYGRRLGVTDLSVVTEDGTVIATEVAVVADLGLLRARVAAMLPEADVRFGQIRDHIVVEGEVADSRQAALVVQAVNAYLLSLGEGRADPPDPAEVVIREAGAVAGEAPPLPPFAQLSDRQEISPPRVVNLLRVPGPQQVLLKVQVAELNRTALRELGVSFLVRTGGGGFGSNVSGDLPFGGGSTGGTTGTGGSAGSPTGGGGQTAMTDPLSVTNLLTAGTPLFGVFGGADFNVFLSALRRNDLFRVLAEPNLVALQGQEASFLAGGEFPIPVPQATAGTGSVITVAYREFGVGLTFIPFLIDGDTVRLSVAPEVSSLDFAQGVTLQGFRVPALNKRRTSTVVQLRHGQTLAIGGLLQLEITGTTGRIPGLGDLPYLGAFFRNNSMRRTEKELVILVTPYLVRPMDPQQVPPRPGDLSHEPDDYEFYALGHLEALYQDGRYRSTAAWADALGVEAAMELHDLYLNAEHGFSACPPRRPRPPPELPMTPLGQTFAGPLLSAALLQAGPPPGAAELPVLAEPPAAAAAAAAPVAPAPAVVEVVCECPRCRAARAVAPPPARRPARGPADSTRFPTATGTRTRRSARRTTTTGRSTRRNSAG